jgi:uridine kinase
MITLYFEGKALQYPDGADYRQVAADLTAPSGHDIVLIKENGELRELFHRPKDGAEIVPVTTADTDGHRTYQRSMNLLLYRAIDDISGDRLQVILHFSHGNGYYYTITGENKVDPEWLHQVGERMQEIVQEGVPIVKRTVPTADARSLFKKRGMTDKDVLFRYRRTSSVNLYRIGEYEDYNYGFMVPDTSYLRYFQLVPYAEGFVLVMPERSAPEEQRPFQPSEKLFRVQDEAEKWGETMHIDTVGGLNDQITRNDIAHTMLVEEAMQESRISDIAETIAKRPEVKFVLIAGPSSSGKTTFSRRLSIQLTAHGRTPHPISLDNYYKERAEVPRDAEGNYDFECLEALDLDLFRKQMSALLSGEQIELPRYDFTKGGKDYKGDLLRLGEDDILVFEGIHGLNDQLSSFIPKGKKFRIYISALTQLNIDWHNRIPTTDARLIRRIVRDYRTRATSARETIEMWDSVRRGEEKYIFPNQESADVIFNSAMTYELSVLKVYAEPLLFQIRETDAEYLEAKRLLKFLDYFVGIPSENIPINSVIREFIGGSCFDV